MPWLYHHADYVGILSRLIVVRNGICTKRGEMVESRPVVVADCKVGSIEAVKFKYTFCYGTTHGTGTDNGYFHDVLFVMFVILCPAEPW